MPDDSNVIQRLPNPRVGGPPPSSVVIESASRFRVVIAKSRVLTWGPPLIMFLILGSIWQLYATDINRFVIPTYGKMISSLGRQPTQYWDGLRTTIREVAIGWTGGLLLAFLAAFLISELRVLARALMPFVVILMLTPIVAIAPALVIAFGVGAFPKYLVAGMLVFPPMLIHTLAGLRNVDSKALDFFETLDANRLETFRYLRLQSSLPFVFVGLRIALPLSVVGAVIAEVEAPGVASGLGSLVSTAASVGNIAVTWTAIYLLCLLGLAMMALWLALRRRILWWDNEAALTRRGR